MSARETVTAGAWTGSARYGKSGALLATVNGSGWQAWDTDDQWDDSPPVFRGPETGQAGRDAADAALRAAGVVLL